MTLSELIPTIQALPRADKLRLIQLLTNELDSADKALVDVAERTVPIWSPHDACEGVATLMRVLADDKAASE
jgi:iron-sulfur cluster repair protein YtfE (RIC family)